MRVLVVEDGRKLAQVLGSALEANGGRIALETAHSGAAFRIALPVSASTHGA